MEIPKKKFQPCILTTKANSKYYGYLYINNERVVVLLNDITSKAYLGPLRNKREKHVEPEANIFIFPRKKVRSIEPG